MTQQLHTLPAQNLVEQFLQASSPHLRHWLPAFKTTITSSRTYAEAVLNRMLPDNLRAVDGTIRHHALQAELNRLGLNDGLEVVYKSVDNTSYTEARVRFGLFELGLVRKSYMSKEKLHMSKLKLADCDEVTEFFGHITFSDTIPVYLNFEVGNSAEGEIRNAQLFLVQNGGDYYNVVSLSNLLSVMEADNDYDPVMPDPIELKIREQDVKKQNA